MAPSAAADDLPAAAAAPPASTRRDSEPLRRAQRMLLERAKQRYEAGRAAGDDARPALEAALDALDLAYGLVPAPWLLFNIAQVQSRLGACSAAADLYRRFLASGPAPEARQSAESALELLGPCADPSSEPALDDAFSPTPGLSSSLDEIFIARVEPSPAQPAPAPVESAAASGAASVLPWVFGSLALTSGIAGGIYWSEAHAAKRDLDHIRVAGPNIARTQQRGESAQDLARVFGGVAVGFALAAGASYWWLRSEPGEAPVATAFERLSFVPLAGGGGALYRSDF